jgi:hypothetical protein
MRVIRGFASGKTHVANLPAEAVQDLLSFNVPCRGRLDSWISACGTEVGATRGFVIMQSGTKVRCVSCKRLTGMVVAS